jgi:hypothetical protein
MVKGQICDGVMKRDVIMWWNFIFHKSKAMKAYKRGIRIGMYHDAAKKFALNECRYNFPSKKIYES